RDRSDGATAALRAADAVRPAQVLEVAPAALLGLLEVAEPAGVVQRRDRHQPRSACVDGDGTTRPTAEPGSQTIQPPSVGRSADPTRIFWTPPGAATATALKERLAPVGKRTVPDAWP